MRDIILSNIFTKHAAIRQLCITMLFLLGIYVDRRFVPRLSHYCRKNALHTPDKVPSIASSCVLNLPVTSAGTRLKICILNAS